MIGNASCVVASVRELIKALRRPSRTPVGPVHATGGRSWRRRIAFCACGVCVGSASAL